MKIAQVNLVMLAGAMRASELRRQLGLPVLSLPLLPGRTLLDLWLEAFEALATKLTVRLVVNGVGEVRLINELVSRHAANPEGAIKVHVVPDPAKWRGTGGLVRDVAKLFVEDDGPIVVAESSCLPPSGLGTLLAMTDGGVGVSDTLEPAGVYLLTRAMVQTLPNHGFCDLKEQFLPALHQEGFRLRPVTVTNVVRRIRDRESYLDLIRGFGPKAKKLRSENDDGRIASTSRLGGTCLIDPTASIEDGAIVHDSVLMAGAVVKRQALVSRSIVGRDAVIDSGTMLRDAVAPAADRLRTYEPPERGTKPVKGQLIRQG